MAYPDKPQILTSYTAAEQSLGDGSLPGQELDTDLANLQLSTEQVIDFLKLFTRSDGKLANGIVTQESLAASIRIGFDPPSTWATGQAYTTRSTVFQGFGFYLCTVEHTAGLTFNPDFAAGRWQLLADLTPPGGALIAANNLADLSDVPTARVSMGLGTAATRNVGAAAGQVPVLDGSGRLPAVDGSLLTGIGGVPTGIICMWSGAIGAIPSGWALCDGANGTPNLRDRFIVGAGSAYGVGATGGQNEITSVPAHTHGAGTLAAASGGAHTHTGSTDSAGAHTHTFQQNTSGTAGTNVYSTTLASSGNTNLGSMGMTSAGAHTHTLTIDSGGAHTHTVSGSTASTGSASVDIRPLYYALAYIMKV